MIPDVCRYSVQKAIYVHLLELAPALKCHYSAAGMSVLTYHVYQTRDYESGYNPWILLHAIQ